jgi:hypothetical protein
MAEVVERVAKLEERWDGLSRDMTELRQSMGDFRHEVALRFDTVDRRFLALEGRMDVGFGTLHQRIDNTNAAMTGEFAKVREEMNTQFRWIMGGIGGATLTILVAVLAAILAKS